MMDRALQERVIGAVVLVVAAILVVPVFLDGPANDEEIVSESVTLPGQNEQERKTQTIVLERDRTEPVPTGAAAVLPEPQKKETEADSPPPKPEPQAQVAVASAPAAATSDTAPREESSTGMWAVQLGSFSNQENAERLASDLRKQGFAAFLSQHGAGSDQLHRVRIGPQKDRATAESVAAELGNAGHKGQVVPHP